MNHTKTMWLLLQVLNFCNFFSLKCIKLYLTNLYKKKDEITQYKSMLNLTDFKQILPM